MPRPSWAKIQLHSQASQAWVEVEMRGVSETAESPLEGRNWNKLGEVRRRGHGIQDHRPAKPETINLTHSF